MADQLYDNPISDATDWGGDASTGNIPVAGRRVQEYIKKRFSDDEETLDELNGLSGLRSVYVPL